MATGTHTLLERITVGAAGAASVTFSSIPQTGYTDLKIVYSARSAYAQIYDPVGLQINGDTGYNYYTRRLWGTGASATSDVPSAPSTLAAIGLSVGGSATASTFGNVEIYFPNAFGSTQKSFSGDAVSENNATTAYATLTAHLWTGTSAITSFKILPGNGTSTFVQFSTFSLYGIAASGTTPTKAPKAVGGDIIQTDGTYWYHAFINTGAFVPATALTADVLVVAGGGGGGVSCGGGGGAGGLVYTASQSLTPNTYTVTVGGGGAGGSTSVSSGNGTNSSVTGGSLSLTAAVGGGAGGQRSPVNRPGQNGGSGGGADVNNDGFGTGTSGQGNNGGSDGTYAGCGGGGAGAVGGNSVSTGAGNGGAGSNTYSSWATATSTGVSGYYAGGGGGGPALSGATISGTGGSGGGGAGSASVSGAAGNPGTANTGGGGGGSVNAGSPTGGAGGSGIVIVRYLA